jgi:hypothetical protein
MDIEVISETESETELERSSFIDVGVDCDRSERNQFLHQISDPISSNVVGEEREPINGAIGVTAPVAYGPLSCTVLGSFYTPTNDGPSPPPLSSHSSPSSKQMDISSRHSSSSSDFTIPAPPAVEPAPAPILSPAARGSSGYGSKPTVPGEPRLDAVRAPSPVATKGAAGKKSPKSVSRLCFPFVTTSAKQKEKDRKSAPISARCANPSVAAATGPAVSLPPVERSSPRRLHKYSCSPTRFSPFRVDSQRPSSRHAYANRGYSHEALDYVKSFWHVRQEGMKSGGGTKPYMEKPQVARTVHPGTAHQTHGSVGESKSPTTVTPPCTSTATDSSDEEDVPPSIHPRRGDISALKDPQCAEVDREFGALGVWTIAKMVWMVEVDVGIGRLERERQKEKEEQRRRRSRLRMRILWDEHDSEDGDEGELLDESHRSTSMSSLSDDSEMTLVDDVRFCRLCRV